MELGMLTGAPNASLSRSCSSAFARSWKRAKLHAHRNHAEEGNGFLATCIGQPRTSTACGHACAHLMRWLAGNSAGRCAPVVGGLTAVALPS